MISVLLQKILYTVGLRTVCKHNKTVSILFTYSLHTTCQHAQIAMPLQRQVRFSSLAVQLPRKQRRRVEAFVQATTLMLHGQRQQANGTLGTTNVRLGQTTPGHSPTQKDCCVSQADLLITAASLIRAQDNIMRPCCKEQLALSSATAGLDLEYLGTTGLCHIFFYL